MTLRIQFLALVSVTSLLSAVGCSADFEEDDIAQDSAALGGNVGGTLGGALKPRSITRARCIRGDGTISRSPASLSRSCTRAGYSGDVCTMPNPAYDPSDCTIVVVEDDKVATQPAPSSTPCARTLQLCVE